MAGTCRKPRGTGRCGRGCHGWKAPDGPLRAPPVPGHGDASPSFQTRLQGHLEPLCMHLPEHRRLHLWTHQPKPRGVHLQVHLNVRHRVRHGMPLRGAPDGAPRSAPLGASLCASHGAPRAHARAQAHPHARGDAQSEAWGAPRSAGLWEAVCASVCTPRAGSGRSSLPAVCSCTGERLRLHRREGMPSGSAGGHLAHGEGDPLSLPRIAGWQGGAVGCRQ